MKKACAPELRFLSLLDAGCRELEAFLRLICIHRATGRAQTDSGQKLIAKATEEALFYLAFVKVHSLVFDETDGSASLANFLKINPVDSGSSKLFQLVTAVIEISPVGPNHYQARELSLDEIRSRQELLTYNKERSADLIKGHAKVHSLHKRLSKHALTGEMNISEINGWRMRLKR